MASATGEREPTPERATTSTPARRNSSAARGKWVRSLTSTTLRQPRERSMPAASRALPSVSSELGSVISAVSGTPSADAKRRMISASGSDPLPPPHNSRTGAAPSR